MAQFELAAKTDDTGGKLSAPLFKLIKIRDFNMIKAAELKTLVDHMHAIATKNAAGTPYKVWMHCSTGKGRTGYNVMLLDRYLSPFDGLTFD